MVSPITCDELLQRLDGLGISYSFHRHPATPTVKEGIAFRKTMPGVHCKNLFLRDTKKRYWLITMPIERHVNLKELPALIGSTRLSFAQPQRLMEKLGVEPGSVTPFAVVHDQDTSVSVILDDEMMRQPLLNVHPLVNTATIGVSPQDLLRFILSCGHKPCMVDFGPISDSLDFPHSETVSA